MCIRHHQPILTIGTKPGGIIYISINHSTEKPLADFIADLPTEERDKVIATINEGLNSCAIQKAGEAPKAEFLYIFYGTINEGRAKKKNVDPQVKLFVKYSAEHLVFVTPSRRERAGRLFDELKTCAETLMSLMPLDKPGHTCGVTTEKRMGFRAE